MENEIKNRIQIVMDSEQLNPGAFAKRIDVNPSAMSHILNGRNKPSMDIITKILKTFPHINSEWLILGTGNFSNQIRNSQGGLFDVISEANTEDETQYSTFDSSINKSTMETIEQSHKTEDIKNSAIEMQVQKEIEMVSVKRIIVYYSNNTFEEFLSKHSD